MSYLPDPPKKPGEKPDLLFSVGLRPRLHPIDLGDVDLRSFTTESDQYSAGSCAGNAVADALELLNAVEGLPHVQLSRLFIYTLARNMSDVDGDGRSDINLDEGTFIRNCFDVIKHLGVCREDLPVEKGGWPYDLTKVHTLPSIKAMRAATGHRIHSYYRIDETGEDRLDQILAALRARRPVVFGTQVTKGFQKLRGLGPVTVPTGPTAGGHAMMVVGYITGQGFIIKNSWGRDWGEGGFCIMRPEYLAWSKTRDLWVPTKGSEFR